MTALYLRMAKPEDVENLYAWRNHANTRLYSFNTTPITWEAHVTWFENTLKRRDKIILIGEIEQSPIGVLKFNLVNQHEAILDIYLVPAHTGKGLGSRLLVAGLEWAALHTEIKKLKAEIRSDNIASLKAFVKAGFKEHHRVMEYHLL